MSIRHRTPIVAHPRRTRPTGPGRRRPPARPAVEALERREVPSTLTWRGVAGPNWNVAGNWSPSQVPSDGDGLIFPASASNKVTDDNLPATLSPASIEIDAAYTLDLTAGDLDLLQDNGSITGSGSLTTGGTATLIAPQNGINLNGQIALGGPVKIGMSSRLPRPPKILKNAVLSIVGPEVSLTTAAGVGVEVDGAVSGSGPFETESLSGNGSLTSGGVPSGGIVGTAGGVFVGPDAPDPFSLASQALTVGPGGTISPGTSTTTGPMTIDGSVAFSRGSTLAIGLGNPATGSQPDELFLPSKSLVDNTTPTGYTLDLTRATLALTAAPNLVPGTYTIAQAPSIAGPFPPQSEGGQVVSMADGSQFTVDNITFAIHYTATSVTLTDLNTPTSTSLTASTTSALLGRVVTLDATVAAVPPGPSAPTGSVTFLDGSTVLGTAPVNGSGVAQFLTASLGVGPHSITASYSGDAVDASSASAALGLGVAMAVPTLSMLGSDDSGVPGDGVTDVRQPHYYGVADPGDTIRLYAVGDNGQLTPAQATATASPVDGSFTIELPYNLSNGGYHLKVQATDARGDVGPLSADLPVRIVTVAGDYYDVGFAQFTVFRPTDELYIVKNAGFLQVDTTPGRDIPVQYDFNIDGKDDLTAYRFNSAEYYGFVSNNTVLDYQFGAASLSLPVSGNYSGTGATAYGLYNPNTGTWAINLPNPGGEVLNYGVPGVDIPVPAAYDGRAITEIATFRPTAVHGNDADSFNVVAPNFVNNYQVSFTDPTVPALKQFVYEPGDIPAPADYDGVGRDEFAVYRPSTGQFFILNVPNLFDKTTWTLRVVTLNLPGGPEPGDEPAPADYEGTGKASPTVFRPSNSTFYEIQTTNGIQQNIQFGEPGVDVAAAGPLLYRLSALQGSFASTDGYPSTTSYGGGASSLARRASANAGPGLSAAVAAASTGGGPSGASSTKTDLMGPGVADSAIPIPLTTLEAAPDSWTGTGPASGDPAASDSPDSPLSLPDPGPVDFDRGHRRRSP